MPSLARLDRRFATRFDVIEGGSGKFTANLAEAPIDVLPAYTFVSARRVLLADPKLPLKEGMVVRSEGGIVFILGHNGTSEFGRAGVIWKSYRLFEATGQYAIQRRTKTVDPVTQLEREGVPQNLGNIWGAMEPLEREAFDRQARASVETARFICGFQLTRDDTVAGRPVTKLDTQLGVQVAALG